MMPVCNRGIDNRKPHEIYPDRRRYINMVTRRQFLQAGAAAALGAYLSPTILGGSGKAYAVAPAASPNLTKWVDPLIVPPVLTPDGTAFPGVDYYEITMSGAMHKFHSQLAAGPTYAYAPMPYLGPTIEAKKGTPVKVKWVNNLPLTHPVQTAIDPTVPDPMMYGELPTGRAVPHLHGGFTPPQFDGHPHQWFTPSRQKGPHYASDTYTFPNDQAAASLWYHDHAMGITRLNVYAGLAGLYFLRDEYDTGVVGRGLNIPKGDYEIPLVLQDKTFNANGSMFYPTVGVVPGVHPVWVPEFYGDTPVINAKAYPYLDVEPRRYRFRIVNGSQARFYNMWFDNGNAPVPFYVIGMEGGLLPAPVPLSKVLLAPGERVDIIFDFTGMQNGTLLTLKNNAKAPYPGGRGGACSQLMQLRVVKPLAGTDTTTPPAQLMLPSISRLTPTTITPMREIVLKEDMDPVAGEPIDVRINARWFDEPVEENPKAGSTEVWQFINLTVDAHPMHMHLVQFQILDRQEFDAAGYTAAWLAWIGDDRPIATKPILERYLTKAPIPPAPEETGWKDTAKVYPGEILRVIAKFDIPQGTQLPAEYVYHCHILEHEENEMMRPFRVVE